MKTAEETAICIKKLKDCIIKDNRLMSCATQEVYIDEGEHVGENVIEITGSTQDTVGEYLFPFFDD